MFHSWVGKISLRREQLPTPVFWPGEFHGQRNLAGYSPWSCKESNKTERLSLCFSCGSAGKESACNAEDLGLIPGLGRAPGEGNSYPLQYSGLENSMDYTVCGILHARILEWVDFSFSNGSSQPRNQTGVFCIAGRFFTS